MLAVHRPCTTAALYRFSLQKFRSRADNLSSDFDSLRLIFFADFPVSLTALLFETRNLDRIRVKTRHDMRFILSSDAQDETFLFKAILFVKTIVLPEVANLLRRS